MPTQGEGTGGVGERKPPAPAYGAGSVARGPPWTSGSAPSSTSQFNRGLCLPNAEPLWNSAGKRPELNKTRRDTLEVPLKFVALVRSWAGSKKGKVPKRGERVYAAPGATSLSGDNFFPCLFHACHSRLRSGSVDQQKCNSFRRKTGSFLASGPGLRKLRAPDWPERVAVPGSAHFQGEDVRKRRIRGWGHGKNERKRPPVCVVVR